MCADDVVCSGAEPIAFLDYVAVGRLDPIGVAELVGSVAAGCREAGCTLIGGETAEHPGLMPEDAFDLAGSCIGVVEREALIDGSAVRAGDAILGLAASGLHANGYSLVRSLIAQWDLDLGRPYQEQLRRSLGDADRDALLVAEPEHELATLGEVLLTPTRIYARGVLAARRQPAVQAGSTCAGWPTSPAAACRGTCRGRCRPASGRDSIRAAGRCRRSCGCSARWAGSRTTSFGRPSTAGSGWSRSWLRTPCRPRFAAFAAEGLDARPIGEVAPVDELGGRYAEGPLERLG